MITSTSNPNVKWVRALQSRRRTREKERVFVIEGRRLASEAAAAGLPVQLILYTEDFEREDPQVLTALQNAGGEMRLVSEAVMAAASDTETPQGVLAVLPEPNLKAPVAPGLSVIVDRLADPGNLGTLLRTAWAAGVELIVLTEGTVDPFNPKVIRGAMGAHFKLPLLFADIEQLTRLLPGVELFLAEARAGSPYYAADWRGDVGLIIGAEAEGPQDALRAIAQRSVHIPMPGGAESLNAAVAAAVILFEAVRQRGVK
jgi:TrmH family RNA methyltransferase